MASCIQDFTLDIGIYLYQLLNGISYKALLSQSKSSPSYYFYKSLRLISYKDCTLISWIPFLLPLFFVCLFFVCCCCCCCLIARYTLSWRGFCKHLKFPMWNRKSFWLQEARESWLKKKKNLFYSVILASKWFIP